MRTRFTRRRLIALGLLSAMLVFIAGFALLSAPASAGPQIIGNPHGATSRVLIYDTAANPNGNGGSENAPAANGAVKRIIYFSGVITPVSVGGTVTPVLNSPAKCAQGGASIYRADVYLTGTMTGTAPTVAEQWQNSIDGGAHWQNVGTFTTINATVTPASQSQAVSDLVSSTAVAYGDCWRVQLTFGGTGAVGANLSIVGYAK